MHLEIHLLERRQPVVVVGIERGEFEHGRARRAVGAQRALADRGVADHHPRHVVGGELGDLAAADLLAAAEHRHAVAEGADLAELVRDHDDGDLLALGHAAQQAEHLVGLVRGEHRGRLVEDEHALVEIEELENFELLLLAGGERRHRHVERHPERHAVEERLERFHLLLPVDDRRRVGAADHEVLGAGQRRHQGEMLVDHADAERAGIARIADRDLLAAEQDLALVGRIEPHDAFDERRLAGAVLAEQRMKLAGLDLHRDVAERDQRPEDLGHADGFERDRPRFGRQRGRGLRRRSRQMLQE